MKTGNFKNIKPISMLYHILYSLPVNGEEPNLRTANTEV